MSSKKNRTLTLPGPFLIGTISTAMAKCGKPNCHCRTDPSKRHGPYYRWTGVIKGKPTTITLTEQEAEECKKRIAHWRSAQKKLALMAQQDLARAPWVARKKT